jgi:Phosphotransferase enzyme family
MASLLKSGMNEYSTNMELIEFCANPPQECVLGGIPYGNRVVLISSRALVKFGMGLTEDEAINQSKAYELVDPQIVRIPKVHRYFSDNKGRGYIVMDFVEGEVLEPLEDPIRISTVTAILNHLASFHARVPGPLHRGATNGLLFFAYDGDAIFTDVKDLERWWNLRLLPGETGAYFQGLDLVLCHLDVAPRNILWKDGEVPCLVGWASAGYYPRCFEFCVQLILEGKDGRFNRLLLDAMTQLEEVESRQIAPVLLAWSNMQRYHLYVARCNCPFDCFVILISGHLVRDGRIEMTPPKNASESQSEKIIKIPIAMPPLPPYPAGWLEQMRQHELKESQFSS